MEIRYYDFETSIGRIHLFFTSKGILYLSLSSEDNKNIIHNVERYGSIQRVYPDEYEFHNQINEYLKGRLKKFTLELDLKGTEFQKKVWNELLNVPYGKTTTYKEISTKIGSPRAYRAVGAALNRNPIPIIVPCHRVIGTNGHLTGFAGGLELKRKLLELEGVIY